MALKRRSPRFLFGLIASKRFFRAAAASAARWLSASLSRNRGRGAFIPLLRFCVFAPGCGQPWRNKQEHWQPDCDKVMRLHAQTGLAAASVYPTSYRSNGVGWAGETRLEVLRD
jgi:hypothetical protein